VDRRGRVRGTKLGIVPAAMPAASPLARPTLPAMRNLELVLFLLLVATALARLADRYRVPYPVLLMLAGMALGLIPGLVHLALAPDVVFLVFLPPLLYAAAWNTSWPDFKAARRPIGLLALGCVLFTTTLVAVDGQSSSIVDQAFAFQNGRQGFRDG
jgi:hypothetical protein